MSLPAIRESTSAKIGPSEEAGAAADRLSLVAEALGAYWYEWTVATGHVVRSPELVALLGFSADEVGDHAAWWQRRIHPDDLAGPIADAVTALHDPAIRRVTAEYRVRHRDGSWRWFRDSSLLDRDVSGKVVRVVGISADISQEREQLEAQKRSAVLAAGATSALRSLLDRMGDGFVEIDRHWRITHVNAAAARIHGATQQELIGRDAWEVWSVAIGTGFETELRAAMDDGEPRTFREQYLEGDGGAGIWYEDRVYPSADGLSVFFRDVTAEVRAAEALAATERRYARLAEANVVGMVLWDIHGPILEANEYALELLGATREDVHSGRVDLYSLTPPEYADVDEAMRAELIEKGTHAPYQKEFHRSDGSRVPVLVAAAFIEGSRERGVSLLVDQRPILSAMLERDAAKRRAEFLVRAGALLASSFDYEETLQAVARAAVPGLGDWCAVDMRTDVPVGRGASSLFPWPPRVERLAVMHEDPAKVAWAKDLERRMPPDWSAPGGLSRVLREGVTEFYPVITEDTLVASAKSEDELRLLREIDFHAYCCVPLVVRGCTLGAITLAMTDSKRHYEPADLELAEELARRASLAIEHALLLREAREGSLAKSQFLATMSHELRNPLQAIAGYTEVLALGIYGPVNEAQQNSLQRIQKSQAHLLGLIDTLLRYAQVEAGAIEYRLGALAPPVVLYDLEVLTSPQARQKQIELVIECACTEEVRVLCDEEKVRQILLNLVSNSIKFTPRGGRIEVFVRPAPAAGGKAPFVEFVVTDTGAGIAADKLTKIFEPFVQIVRDFRAPREGAGLGLSISRELARGMNGDLAVVSELGKGSTFTLRLPRA